MAVRRIPLPGHLTGDAWIQVVRIRYQPGDAYDEHDHDFAEVFWLESGRALHTVNGVRHELRPGDLTVLRPRDAHSFATTTGFVMVNVTVRAELPAGLAGRFAGLVEPWPWGDAPLPLTTALPAARLERLQELADDLAADHSRLAAEGFLLDLLRLLRAGAGPGGPRPLAASAPPPWLERAVARLAEPAVLAEGPVAFARLCGRTPAHVNRAVRAHYGQTATELVNAVRLDAAGRQLRLSPRSIAEIGAACGFASLAHFYRAFHARFGATPKAFRHGHQAVGRAVAEQYRHGAPVPLTRPAPPRR